MTPSEPDLAALEWPFPWPEEGDTDSLWTLMVIAGITKKGRPQSLAGDRAVPFSHQWGATGPVRGWIPLRSTSHAILGPQNPAVKPGLYGWMSTVPAALATANPEPARDGLREALDEARTARPSGDEMYDAGWNAALNFLDRLAPDRDAPRKDGR